MKSIKSTMSRYYQLIGKLFYSMAAIDGVVRTEEIKTLLTLIQTHWIPLENSADEFGDDAAYQIEIVFDWMVKNNWNEQDVIVELEEFKKVHASLFTKKNNAVLLHTLEKIADSFANRNRSEHLFLHKIKNIIN